LVRQCEPDANRAVSGTGRRYQYQRCRRFLRDGRWTGAAVYRSALNAYSAAITAQRSRQPMR
jgi:hypothetical protein